MALAGLFAGALPLPIVPGRLLRRVRGALAHDIASRYGLSLTPEARMEMALPSRAVRGGAFLTTIAFVARRSLRRIGIIGFLPPLTASLEIYALGLLLDRYLDRTRRGQTVRIDEMEAKKLREVIDLAVRRALAPGLSIEPVEAAMGASEELRDVTTRAVDGLLLAAAALPNYLQRRLETAFDLVLAEQETGDFARHG